MAQLPSTLRSVAFSILSKFSPD